jgi:Phage phiEco32-like COOH.NH2 ligase-type 2
VEFAEIKYSFFKMLVENGYSNVAEIPEESLRGIPSKLVDKWMEQFRSAPVLTCIPHNPRLVNRFTIGADPEFSLMDAVSGKQYPAQNICLQTGLAFGMDMNGRLAELRPTPSRFALDVVASMLAELRWMAIYLPQSLQCHWISSPFDGQDGVGGHVHLARQRSREMMMCDVSSLSYLYSWMLKIGVFNKDLNSCRTANTKYGQCTDVRMQKYGYEYRAFPTWLDTPWLAYLVLVLSKLSVYNRDLTRRIFMNNSKNGRALERAVGNMLAFYKNVDDDAWIAFSALRKWGLPKQIGMDFRANWGILYPQQPLLKGGKYYPSMIEGSEFERQAIFDYLVNKAAIKPELPVCNWEPKAIPEGYEWLMNIVQTYHKFGVGEISNNLVCSQKYKVVISNMDHKDIIQVDYSQYPCVQGIKELKNLLPNLVVSGRKGDQNKLSLHLPSTLRSYDMIPKVKQILTSGLFPLWKVGEVKADSFDLWVGGNKGLEGNNKLIGKELVI